MRKWNPLRRILRALLWDETTKRLIGEILSAFPVEINFAVLVAIGCAQLIAVAVMVLTVSLPVVRHRKL